MVKRLLKILCLIVVLLFIYTPIVVLTFYSLTDAVVLGQWNGFSFNLYTKLFASAKIMVIIKNTIFLAVIAALISTFIGTLGAIGIFYSKKRAAKTAFAISNIPLINAEVVTAISLALLFALPFLKGRSYFSLLAGHTVICAPFVVLSVMPRLKQMDNSLYEAALDLGATPFKAMVKVVIPEILPGIVAGFMLSITLSLDDYIVTAFTKPPTFDTISTYVYNAVKNQTHSELPALRALSALIFVGMISAVLILNFKKTPKKLLKEN